MISVLHVAQPQDAGVARCVVDFARDQSAAGYAVTVACPPEGALARWLRDAGVPVVGWAATRDPGRGVPGETRRLAAIIRDADADLVHLHSSKAGLAGRLALRGRRPTLFQPHAWSFDAVSGAVRRAALAWERHAARWSDRVVCVSAAERAAGAAAGVRARWAVVPNGVDRAEYPPASDADRRAARARLGLPPNAPVVACVGRLSRQKGQDVLLAAWHDVREAVPDACLALVGDGPDEARLRAAAPPGVLFAGRRDDVPDWLAAADVVALPSRWEGMSLAALEALGRGRPLVASDVSGMRELLAGGGGALVPPGIPGPLGAAIVARLRDPALRATEGAAAATTADAHDVRRTTAALRGVYNEVLADRGARGGRG